MDEVGRRTEETPLPDGNSQPLYVRERDRKKIPVFDSAQYSYLIALHE